MLPSSETFACPAASPSHPTISDAATVACSRTGHLHLSDRAQLPALLFFVVLELVLDVVKLTQQGGGRAATTFGLTRLESAYQRWVLHRAHHPPLLLHLNALTFHLETPRSLRFRVSAARHKLSGQSLQSRLDILLLPGESGCRGPIRRLFLVKLLSGLL